MSELGADVIGIGLDPPTNPSHYKVAQIEREIEDLRIDLRNHKSLSQSIKNIKPDYLFHLAAPNHWYDNPIWIRLKLIQQMSWVHFIYLKLSDS